MKRHQIRFSTCELKMLVDAMGRNADHVSAKTREQIERTPDRVDMLTAFFEVLADVKRLRDRLAAIVEKIEPKKPVKRRR